MATLWDYDPSKAPQYSKPPQGYKGIDPKVTQAVFGGARMQGRRVVLGRRSFNALKSNLNPETGQALFFEFEGKAYFYRVRVWRNRVEIAVCSRRLHSEILSVSFPETEEQLRRALEDLFSNR